MRERDLDRMFVAACKRRGIMTYKISSWANRGVFDRLLLGPGRRLGFVELKNSNGKLTHHQAHFEACMSNKVFTTVLFAGPDRNHTSTRVNAVLDRYFDQGELYHPEYRPL